MWHRSWRPRAYSLDLRERLIRARDAGLSEAEVERTLGVSPSTQRRWRRRVADDRGRTPGVSPGRSRAIPPDDEADLRAQVAAHPDATLAAHCTDWAAAGNALVSSATMSRTLARLKLPLKKRR